MSEGTCQAQHMNEEWWTPAPSTLSVGPSQARDTISVREGPAPEWTQASGYLMWGTSHCKSENLGSRDQRGQVTS